MEADNNMDDQLQKTAEDILKRLKEMEESKEWKENGTKPCAQFKMSIDKRVATKGIAVAEYPIAKVVEFLEKEESLAKMNNQIV